jgi:hypothetical protein
LAAGRGHAAVALAAMLLATMLLATGATVTQTVWQAKLTLTLPGDQFDVPAGAERSLALNLTYEAHEPFYFEGEECLAASPPKVAANLSATPAGDVEATPDPATIPFEGRCGVQVVSVVLSVRAPANATPGYVAEVVLMVWTDGSCSTVLSGPDNAYICQVNPARDNATLRVRILPAACASASLAEASNCTRQAAEQERDFMAGFGGNASAPLNPTSAPPGEGPSAPGGGSLLPLGLGLLALAVAAALAVLLRRRGRWGSAAPEPGKDFLGKYRVVRELGRGAFGSTWLAEHRDLRRKVVIKQLHPEWSAVPEARARFEREARILAQLDHPRVTRIYDVENTGSAWYLVMEYVDGGTLADRAARGAVPRPEAVRLLGEVLQGLGYIHGRGVLHRDLKPSNILLTRAGEVKIADFGVARSAAPQGTLLTQAGSSPPGTPLYLAPEQLRGGPGDARSDLYAVAVLAYELLAGRHYLAAHAGDPVLLLRAIAEMPPPLPLPGTGDALNAWLARGLAKRPEERFASAEEMARELRGAVGRAAGRPVRAPSGGPSPA